MTLEHKTKAFAELGKFLSQFTGETSVRGFEVLYNDSFYDRMVTEIALSQSRNGWFTPEQVRFAINSWSKALSRQNLDRWLAPYHIMEGITPKVVGLVLAGNIPLVGFHDFLSVLVTGHKALVRLSSADQKLLPLLAEYLIAVQPDFASLISFTEQKLEGFDAVIATGSNNTSRYFEYYFRDVPSIIRRNRNSVAVLTGNETREQLTALGEDIFRYFGLGCRNVSKLFVPTGYDFKLFFDAMYEYRDVIEYEKYANNYDYNKAVFLMSRYQLLDNGFMTIKEDRSYASPISSVFYEHYYALDEVLERLSNDRDQIQCIVTGASIQGSVDFGKSQNPELWDYADGIDTIRFLISL